MNQTELEYITKVIEILAGATSQMMEAVKFSAITLGRSNVDSKVIIAIAVDSTRKLEKVNKEFTNGRTNTQGSAN